MYIDTISSFLSPSSLIRQTVIIFIYQVVYKCYLYWVLLAMLGEYMYLLKMCTLVAVNFIIH